jgi:biotin synthase
MNRAFYSDLAAKSIAGDLLDKETCQKILNSSEIEILPLLDAAFQVRKKFRGMEVIVHIINNAQNGHCPEDCHYCAQAKSSKADIEEYPIKSDEEILAEAKAAYDKGAYRYCMVFAGRGPSPRRVEKLAELVKKIKTMYPQGEVCVSTGLLNLDGAKKLKEAGLDRLNHNLNTSEKHYPNICTTHTFQDRLNTLQAGREAGIQLCSGLIAGMGEGHDDIIDVALRLRELKAESIPVNFLIPIEGNVLTKAQDLTPEFCLRILCLYRFLNPASELRVSAGREGHLRSMEVMALYPANSLFLQGYLNAKGSSNSKTLRMIKDAGFAIKSECDLDDLIAGEGASDEFQADDAQTLIKTLKELRPQMR